MIAVENDYEPIIYEQPSSSHTYKNKSKLLHNYYTRPINHNTRTTQEVNEIKTAIKPDKKRGSTMLKHKKKYLSNHAKRTTERKNLDNPISLSESKK